MKQMILAIAAAGVLVAGSILPAEAASGRAGGFQGGSGWHGGAVRGGVQPHGGGAGWVGRGGHVSGRWHGGTRVFIGGSFGWWGWPGWWGPGWWGPGWWGGPYPYYPYSPYYSAPPVVVPQGPTGYIQQDPPSAQQYWYYCKEADGYYPYVKECPSAWMQVVPQPVPPGR